MGLRVARRHSASAVREAMVGYDVGPRTVRRRCCSGERSSGRGGRRLHGALASIDFREHCSQLVALRRELSPLRPGLGSRRISHGSAGGSGGWRFVWRLELHLDQREERCGVLLTRDALCRHSDEAINALLLRQLHHGGHRGFGGGRHVARSSRPCGTGDNRVTTAERPLRRASARNG